MTQLVYNTSVNQIIDMILFFVNYKYNINLFFKLKKATVLIEQVNIITKKIQQRYKELKKDIKFLLHRLTFYHNLYRSEESMLKKKNKVCLL